MKLPFKKYNNYVGGTVPIGWHTPTYSEMYYILNSRINALNLRTLGRVDIDGNGNYINGFFLLPDNFVLPVGLLMVITTANYSTNSYNLSDFESLENAGVVFFPLNGYRNGVSYTYDNSGRYFLGNSYNLGSAYQLNFYNGGLQLNSVSKYVGRGVRFCVNGFLFSVSATEKIDFARSNIKYHCKDKIWAFHEHSYDIIGVDNANIDDDYDGWVDLFGFGTSGVNFSPTLHTTNNADYAIGDLLGTPNDWGVNF